MLNILKRLVICTICLPISTGFIQAQGNLPKSLKIDSIGFYFYPFYKSDSIKLTNIKNIDFLNLYYLNGDCSFCLYNMKKAEELFQLNKNKLIKNLFVVKTLDTISFNFHRDKFDIETPVVWDIENILLNKQNFEENILIIIDNTGKIFLKGDFINDTQTKNKYLNFIEKTSYLPKY